MKRLFGFLAVAGLMTFAAPVVPVQAVPLMIPGTAAQTKILSDDLAIQVRRGGGHFRGFHGGGRHFGRAHFGGHRFGHRHHFHRHHFVHHRPFIVRRHVWRPYPYYYAEPRYCRRVWTDFGPRRICRHRPWWA
jgi:hypothetical protein